MTTYLWVCVALFGVFSAGLVYLLATGAEKSSRALPIAWLVGCVGMSSWALWLLVKG